MRTPLNIGMSVCTDYRLRFLSFYIKQSYKSLLDVSCGKGQFANYWKWKGFEVRTTEGNKDLVIARNEEGLHCEYVDLNDTPLHIPYSNNQFDVVTCTDVIEHIKNPLQVVQELIRVAKHLVLITTPVGESYWSPDHIHFWTPEKLNALLINNTFETIVETYVTKPEDYQQKQRSFQITVFK